MDRDVPKSKKYSEQLWEDSGRDVPPQSVLFRYMMRGLRYLNVEIKDLNILNSDNVCLWARSDAREYLKYHYQESGICEGLSQVASCLIGHGKGADWLIFLDVCNKTGGFSPDKYYLTAKQSNTFIKISKTILQCQFGLNLSEDEVNAKLDRIIFSQRVEISYDYKLIDTNMIPLLRHLRVHGSINDKAKALAFLFNDIELPKTNLFFGDAQLRTPGSAEYTRIVYNSETIEDIAYRFEQCPYLFLPPNRVAFQTKVHSTAIISLPHVASDGTLSFKWAIFTPNYGGIDLPKETPKSSGNGIFRVFNRLFSKPVKLRTEPLAQGGLRVFSDVRDALVALFNEHKFEQNPKKYLINIGGCGPQWSIGMNALNLKGPISSCSSIALAFSLIDFVKYMNQLSSGPWQQPAQALAGYLDNYRELLYNDHWLNPAGLYDTCTGKARVYRFAS